MNTKIKQYIIERCLSPDMNSMTINRIELVLLDTTQARVQEFARGGAQNLKAFFFFFFFFLLFNFSWGGPAQKLAEKMTFSTKKVAKYM